MPLEERSMAAGEISSSRAEIGDSDADDDKAYKNSEKQPMAASESSEWDIIGFLVENKEEGSFEQKVDSYVKDLEFIANNEQGKRQEKAQLLIDNYKKASGVFFFLEMLNVK
ncbi:hypothetical protein BC936DRAFT_140320, partial [Jimgerdemannia flammicorona]